MAIEPFNTNLDSADVVIQTADQYMALSHDTSSGSVVLDDDATLLASGYRTLYAFTITAEFTAYPNMALTFTMDDVELYIRDYCYGMVLDGPPEVWPQSKHFNLTLADGDPTTINLSQYLLHDQGSFVLG